MNNLSLEDQPRVSSSGLRLPIDPRPLGGISLNPPSRSADRKGILMESAMNTQDPRTPEIDRTSPHWARHGQAKTIDEALEFLGPAAPSREAIRGEAPWPTRPTSLLDTPAKVYAWSFVTMNRTAREIAAAPARTPVSAPDPSTIRSFDDLVAAGIEATVAFEAKYPADYQRLREDLRRKNDPQGLRHTAYAAHVNTPSPRR